MVTIKRRGDNYSMSLAFFLLGVALSVAPAYCRVEDGGFVDMKAGYYSPGSGGHGSGSPHNGGSYGSPTPTYGGSPPTGGGTYTPPSSGGGSYTPPSGGGNYNPPSSGSGYSPPAGGAPGGGSLTPPSSGGGYYNSPPTGGDQPGGGSVTPPTTSGGYYNPPPTSGEPGGPSLPPPSTGFGTPPLGGSGGGFPPLGGGGFPPIGGGGLGPLLPGFDPHLGSPLFGTCGWWLAHPQAIWGIFGGYLGSVGVVFGALCIPVFGHDLTLPQALANTRTDAIGALFREGTASYLNSMANRRFPFTTEEVRDRFTTALLSVGGASTQADIFRQANEGRLRPRA